MSQYNQPPVGVPPPQGFLLIPSHLHAEFLVSLNYFDIQVTRLRDIQRSLISRKVILLLRDIRRKATHSRAILSKDILLRMHRNIHSSISSSNSRVALGV